MGIFQGDLILHSALTAIIADMRKNLFLLDDMYSCLLSDPYLKNKYGQQELDKFKKFFTSTKIFINTQHDLDKAQFPSITIEVGSGDEDTGKGALGDSYVSEQVDPATLGGNFQAPIITLGPVTPIDYDSLTGQMIFGDGVSLAKVYDGQFVFDEVNQVAHEIILVLDDKTLLIEAGLKPNLNGMTIRPAKNLVGHTRRSIWAWENYNLTLAATEATQVLYLYTLVIYGLGRYKKSITDSRNLAITTMSYGPIYRMTSNDDPNNVYGRDIRIRGRVEHSFIESTLPIIEGINHEIKIDEMQTPDAFLDQAENQGWKGSEDP